MNTFGRNLQLAALSNVDRLYRLVARSGRSVLDLLNNFVALKDFTEHDVPTIKPAIVQVLAVSSEMYSPLKILCKDMMTAATGLTR